MRTPNTKNWRRGGGGKKKRTLPRRRKKEGEKGKKNEARLGCEAICFLCTSHSDLDAEAVGRRGGKKKEIVSGGKGEEG